MNSLASNESQCVLWSDMAFVALWKIVSCTTFWAFLSFPLMVTKKSVEQSCKIVLKVLISCCCFSSWCQFFGKCARKPCYYVYFGLFLVYFGFNICCKFLWEKWVSVNFHVFCNYAGGGPLFCDGINYDRPLFVTFLAF